jgi:hypothetical protein
MWVFTKTFISIGERRLEADILRVWVRHAQWWTSKKIIKDRYGERYQKN